MNYMLSFPFARAKHIDLATIVYEDGKLGIKTQRIWFAYAPIQPQSSWLFEQHGGHNMIIQSNLHSIRVVLVLYEVYEPIYSANALQVRPHI